MGEGEVDTSAWKQVRHWCAEVGGSVVDRLGLYLLPHTLAEPFGASAPSFS